MALPSSGQLSISQIRNEQVNNGGYASSYSLRQLSINAGFSTPDAISDFYGYSAATNVFISVHIPSYMGCYNYYYFAATSTQNVNTNVTVYISWYGDLGGLLVTSLTLNSGTSCVSNYSVYTGGNINCIGENLSNIFWLTDPVTSGNQNYVVGNYFPNSYPC
jgi:hypothetical protein